MITNAGQAVLRGRIEAVTALFAGNFYMAMSTDNTAVALTDTVLPSELTGNGLARALVTFAHTVGTNVWTCTNTFTYSGTTTTNVWKIALFDAATGGNLIQEALATNFTGFNNAGDNGTFQLYITV